MSNTNDKIFFEKNAYLVIENLLVLEEVGQFRKIYDDSLAGKTDTGSHRSHLSGSGEERELITQIMWPSLLLE